MVQFNPLKLYLRCVMAAMLALAALPVTASKAHQPPPDQDNICHEGNPVLTLDTGAGSLQIRLFPDAAPQAVAGFLELVDDETGNHLSGLTFDYTRPRVEIRTAARADSGATLPAQISADALGLDKLQLDRATAMSVIQNELVPAYRAALRGDELTDQLRDWLGVWYEDRDAGFLVGTTRKAVNEALGYRYQDALPSRPVRRGSVALVPASKDRASAQLSIALTNLSRRDGKWMVIGEVIQGIDLAERISSAPLDIPPNTKRTGWRPKDPVVIDAVSRTCAGAPTRTGESL